MADKRLVPKLPNECGPDEESISLLALCEAVHMVASGVANECMRKSEVDASLNDLRGKLLSWRPSPEHTKRYDDIVKALVEATIAEWDER